jgi:hypothetical protein
MSLNDPILSPRALLMNERSHLSRGLRLLLLTVASLAVFAVAFFLLYGDQFRSTLDQAPVDETKQPVDSASTGIPSSNSVPSATASRPDANR